MTRASVRQRTVHLVLVVLLGLGGPAAAATFTVDSTADTVDASPGDGLCDDGSGACTLRAAIMEANAWAGTDTIAFAIPGTGPHTLQPASPLPNVSEAAVIDGYTQPGASANTNGPGLASNAVLMVEIDGSSAGTGQSGLTFTGGGSTVRGLVVNRYVRDGATGGHAIVLGSNGNTVEGCYLGVDPSGTVQRANQRSGVWIYRSNNTVGGLTPAARNVISGNGDDQILISWNNGVPSANVIVGNFIGPAATGTAGVGTGGSIGTRGNGVNIMSGVGNVVGGSTPAAGNLISANYPYNVEVGGNAADTLVHGNVIGPQIDGSTPIDVDVNGVNGVYVNLSATGTRIGGIGPGEGNVIAATARGVWLSDSSSDTLVRGNLIGVGADGVTPAGNNRAIWGRTSGTGNVIGGPEPEAANVIAYNGDALLYSNPSSAVAITSGTLEIHGNRFFANHLLAIELGYDGVTANDADDVDTGPNGLQNHPVLTGVSGGGATVEGTLDSTASTEFRLDFYASEACDASGFGEGETFLGSGTVTTDAAGDASFAVSPGAAVPAGRYVTATATAPDGSTSELSACLQYDPPYVDLTLAMSDGSATATAGGTVAYTLTYGNAGNVAATEVVLTGTVPVESTFDAGSSTAGWSCAGATCTLALGSVAAADGGTAVFAVTVDSPVAAGVEQLAVTAAIADDGASGADPTPGDNAAADTTPVDAVPDLSLLANDGGAHGLPGVSVGYALTVTNNGDQDASGVVLTATVPAHATFDGAGSTAGFSCAPDTGPGATCTLDLGVIAGGGGWSMSLLRVIVDDPLAAGVDEIQVAASVADDGAGGADPTPADNADDETTPIDAFPDLVLGLSDGDAHPQPGDRISYTLSYANDGNQDATGARLTETVPEYATFDAAASTAGWSCVPDGGPGATCTLVLGALAAGTGDTAVFAVTLDADWSHAAPSVSTTASIADDGANGPDPTPADNTDTTTTLVDIAPPTVTNVDTVPGTGDGTLAACETVQPVWVTHLLVTFSEEVLDPAGHTDPDDVTDPANYLLVAAGPDHDIATVECGALAGDDVAVVLAGVAYASSTSTATLDLGGYLGDSMFRLLVCGSTSVRDLSGQALDGDGDGVGGDDFVRTFRADPDNLYANGHLDCGLDGWLVQETLPGAVRWSTDDTDGSALSGSAQVTVASATGTSEAFALGQCVPLLTEPGYLLGQRLRVTADPGTAVLATAWCEYFSAAGCLGTTEALHVANRAFGDTGATWSELVLPTVAPLTSVSAYCGAMLSTSDGAPFDANVDRLRLLRSDAVIFVDGFELGDHSAWVYGDTPVR